MADFEAFCKRLPVQPLPLMIDAIEAEIRELKGRAGVSKRKGRYSTENFSSLYEADIRKLDKLAEFLSGDYNALNNLSEYDEQLFQHVRSKTRY